MEKSRTEPKQRKTGSRQDQLPKVAVCIVSLRPFRIVYDNKGTSIQL